MSVKSLKNNSTDKTELKAEIIGSIHKIYTFQKIADFQYLPMNSSLSTAPAPKQTATAGNDPTDGMNLHH